VKRHLRKLGRLLLNNPLTGRCAGCEHCTWNAPGYDCRLGVTPPEPPHPRCARCDHCMYRHNNNVEGRGPWKYL
jgi:hypothetical protein